MKNFKKIFIYIFVSVLLTLFVTNICLKIDNNYFENLAIAITNSDEEINTMFNNKIEELKVAEDDELAYYESVYNKLYSDIPDNVKNKEGYLVSFFININGPFVEIMNIKYEFQIYMKALIAGIVFGIFLYIIININFKLSWLRLLLGLVIFIALVFLAGGLVIGIENVIHFHLAKYIFWSIVSYSVIIVANLLIQKITINKLNSSLNKPDSK